VALILYLIRHGKATTRATLPDTPAGSSAELDYDVLHPVGERQSKLLGTHLAGLGRTFDHVFCGPMRRQIDTLSHMRASAAEHGLRLPEPRIVESLREAALDTLVRTHLPRLIAGDASKRELWERASADVDESAMTESSPLVELVAHVIAEWQIGKARAPGVESWTQLRARARLALDELVALGAAGGDAAVITSVGVINGMLAAARATPEPHRFRWLMTSSVSCMIAEGDSITVRSLNDITHLSHSPSLQTLL
jgi:broad specificity phosphatase PhoE